MYQSGTSGRIVAALVSEGILDTARAEAALTVVERSLATTPVPAATPTAADAVKTSPAEGVLAAPPSAPPAGSGRPRLSEVAGYAGAALVVASIVLLGAQYWGEIEPLPRSIIILAIAAVLLVGAALTTRIAGGSWNSGRRLALRPRYFVSTLTLAAAVGVGLAVGSYLFTTRYHPPENYDMHNVSMTWGVSVALVVLLVAYLVVPSIVVHLGLAIAVFNLIVTTWLGEGRGAELWRSLAILVVGATWLVLAELHRWREVTLGRAVGSVYLLAGAQFLLSQENPGWAHAMTFAIALVLFGLYWWRGDWPFLAVGVVALTVSVTEALVEWTEGSLGAGGAVLIAGLTLLASSGGAILLRRRREHHDGQPPLISHPIG
ncbi:hypothetical protein [Aestuariimicrobium kwangyangense]|uniref:hypothetical protein n=1 Tax=Aestuariimicrobium kwangyangense TaxID=396389 RepID=UPI0003B51CD2|nr:hypothetical protein [Aestuariimicrobium kwangyangense]